MHLLTATARLKKHGIPGFHTFRRFWTTRRRDIGVPEDIIRYWVGHAGKDITDRYSKLAENVELRKEWALRAGLGFSLDNIGKPGTQHDKPSAKAAKPKPNRKALLQREIVVKRSPVRRKPVLTVPDVVEASTSSVYVATDEDLDPAFFEAPTPGQTQEEIDAERARIEEIREIMGVK